MINVAILGCGCDCFFVVVNVIDFITIRLAQVIWNNWVGRAGELFGWYRVLLAAGTARARAQAGAEAFAEVRGRDPPDTESQPISEIPKKRRRKKEEK